MMQPDLILFNGKVYADPPATAVAIWGRHIMAVGSDTMIKTLQAPHTQMVNLEGRLLLPGLHDAHFHFYQWALAQNDLQLAGVQSLAQLQTRLQAKLATMQPGQWLKGLGWNESDWPQPTLPTRHDLDAVSPHNPVLLWRADLHIAVANSLALKLTGVTPDTVAPPDSVIEKGSDGALTGILKETAIDLVSSNIPAPGNAQALVKQAINRLHRLGLTGLHDQRIMTGALGPTAWRLYQRLRQQGDLKLRITTNIHYTMLDQAIALGLRSGWGDDYLQMGFVKMFADGSLGARTAWLLAPYAQGGHGLSTLPPQTIAAIVQQAAHNGWAVSIHAIGDRANRELLDIFAKVPPPAEALPFAHRIEHTQIMHPDDVVRLGQLGLTASVQPVHLVDDMTLVGQLLSNRASRFYQFADMQTHGALLALGSDCPVASPNPWWGIHAAVTRRKRDGFPEAGWFPAQRLSLPQAIHGYTLANAQAVGQADKLGSITPGKLADLVVTHQDIFSIDPAALWQTEAVLTVFDGEIVYRNV